MNSVTTNEINISVMNREQLEKFTHNLLKDLTKHKKKRHLFKSETEQMKQYWSKAKDDLITMKERLRDVDLKMQKEKIVKDHKIHAMIRKIKSLKGDAKSKAMAMHKSLDEKIEKTNGLKFKNDSSNFNIHKSNVIKEKIQSKSMHVAKEKKEIGKCSDVPNKKFNNLYDSLANDLDFKFNTNVEQMKTKKEVYRQHTDDDFKNNNNYLDPYNHSLINALQLEIDHLTENNENVAKLIVNISQKNTNLMIPLKKAKKKIQCLQNIYKIYKVDRKVLEKSQNKLKKVYEQIDIVRNKHKTLLKQYQKMTEEKEALKGACAKRLSYFKEKIAKKNLILEELVDKLYEKTHMKSEKINKILLASKPKRKRHRDIEKELIAKNLKIKSLTEELTKMTKNHNEIFSTYETKLNEFGIPKNEVFFDYLDFDHSSKNLYNLSGQLHSRNK